MRSKVTVVGGGALAERLGERDYADVGTDISGATVVVLNGDASGALEEIRDRAPAAVVVVVGESPQTACETTLFPRGRIIGVDGDDQALDVVDAVVLDRHAVLPGVVRCEGELGLDSEYARVSARIGRCGVEEILEAL